MTLASTVVEPIPGHTLLILLLQVGVLLLMALMLGRLAQRFGLPAIVGELGAGIILGPSLLATLAPGAANWLFPQEAGQMHLLDAIAQVGVILLVGFTGMHLDVKVVRRHGGKAGGVALAALLIPMGLGMWVGFMLPSYLRAEGSDVPVFALFLGVSLALSSIPVVARILVDMRLVHRNVGQMILVVATIDDAVAWLMVSLVAAMATTGINGGDISMALIRLVLVIAFALTIGRWLIRMVMRAVARTDVRGLPLTVFVILMTLSGAGTHALHLEAVFGAFLCGVLMGSCKDTEASRLEPLNTTVLAVLAPLFFATAGLRMDLTALVDLEILFWAVTVLVLAVAGKFIGAYVGAIFGRMTRWEALAVGAGINARGVVEIVVAMVGVRIGLLTTEMFSIIVLVAVVTSLMAPPVLRMAARRIEHTAEEELREQRVLELQGEARPSPALATERPPGPTTK
uniref:Sodium/hydrogen exchanger n=1 Tax=Streptomyces sp. CNQ-418 TaxID=467194 RepID=J7GY87_9ACTN|nr:sodium/hydrogen exchanger [Streptomyces sp. CNQ-418]